jgi:hypothetical protein
MDLNYKIPLSEILILLLKHIKKTYITAKINTIAHSKHDRFRKK